MGLTRRPFLGALGAAPAVGVRSHGRFDHLGPMVRRSGAVCACVVLLAACERRATTIAKSAETGWKQVGSWMGRGNTQTETFTSDTGGFRVRWETRSEAPPGTGRLKVVFHSGDSGREIMEAVDVRGNGRGTAEVGDRPRWYYLTIESANVGWTVTVEEPVPLAK
jgi:hypothetical protein